MKGLSLFVYLQLLKRKHGKRNLVFGLTIRFVKLPFSCLWEYGIFIEMKQRRKKQEKESEKESEKEDCCTRSSLSIKIILE
jgi:hypothetical protein